MYELTPTRTTAKAFSDEVRLPGEDAVMAMLRRVKMHEYMMTGGVSLGANKSTGIVSYSVPITTDLMHNYAECPFCHAHAECAAWEMILDGEGYWTAMDIRLKEIAEQLQETTTIAEMDILFSEEQDITDRMSLRPKQTPFVAQPKFQPRPVRDHAASRKIDKQAGKKKPFPWSKDGESVSIKRSSPDLANVASAALRPSGQATEITFDADDEDDE